MAQPPVEQFVQFFVGYGEVLCPKALQILPESDKVCECGDQKTDILMEVWQFPHPISQPPVEQFSQFFLGCFGRCMSKNPPRFTKI